MLEADHQASPSTPFDIYTAMGPSKIFGFDLQLLYPQAVYNTISLRMLS
jgi:hypothetical protein